MVCRLVARIPVFAIQNWRVFHFLLNYHSRIIADCDKINKQTSTTAMDPDGLTSHLAPEDGFISYRPTGNVLNNNVPTPVDPPSMTHTSEEETMLLSMEQEAADSFLPERLIGVGRN
jgi:hypothetical protein